MSRKNNIQMNLEDVLQMQANERAFQVMLLAHKQSYSLKQKFVTSGKEVIEKNHREECDQLKKQKQIYHSSVIMKNRMKKIEFKHKLCLNIFKEVEEQLLELIRSQENHQNSSLYKLFLISTIVEGLVRLNEPHVIINCLQRDRNLITELIPDCLATYQQFITQHIGVSQSLNLVVSKRYLTQRSIDSRELLKEEEDKSCFGGVVLTDVTGKITLKATLDSRLSILKEICFPQIRSMLWGKQKQNSI